LKDLLDTYADLPLPELKTAVLKALHQYSGEALIRDDITLMALEII
jgi:serine phosphatase RsbU (regulator of sigma subunit)